MPVAPAVSVLIVNYNSAQLTRQCVASLRAQDVRAPDGMSGVEIVVVDNASSSNDRELLAGLDTVVLYNGENRGYGAAVNQAIARAKGEFLLFSNPDTWYFPGALQRLLEGFAKLPRCGAVGPKIWWDLDRQFLLPPSDPISLTSHALHSAASKWPRWHRYWERRWLRRAVRYWRAPEPLPQKMLSGACILTRRDVLQSVGGFDERFFLYFEDTDWCRRVSQSGYRLYYLPDADVAHFYNQSAKQESEAAQRLFSVSAASYFSKHYGSGVWKAVSGVVLRLETGTWSDVEGAHRVNLGALQAPPLLQIPIDKPGGYLVQLSPVACCIPAIARFTSGPSLSLPWPVWERLAEGEFYARALTLPDLREIENWRWEKHSAA